jgi:hypothetical protein
MAEGKIVDAWEIYAGEKKITGLKSGTTYGTHRASLNILLLEEAQ